MLYPRSLQALYASLAVLFEASKIKAFSGTIESPLAECRKWLLIDFIVCAPLFLFQIPSFSLSKLSALLLCFFWLSDLVLLWGIHPPLPPPLPVASRCAHLVQPPPLIDFGHLFTPFSYNPFSPKDEDPDSQNDFNQHFMGRHTVRLNPTNTAQLNPENHPFCLSPSVKAVYIPIVLTNIHLAGLRYSITPLFPSGFGKREETEYFDLSPQDLRAIENLRLARLKSAWWFSFWKSEDVDDSDLQTTLPLTGGSQRIVHLRITKAGVVRLECVLDGRNRDTRIIQPFDATVAPCPRVEFADYGRQSDAVRCETRESSQRYHLDASGVTPLSLKWTKSIDGKTQVYTLDGIGQDSLPQPEDGPYISDTRIDQLTAGAMQEVRIPLDVPADSAGDYLCALEEITDALGNTVKFGGALSTTDKNTLSKTKLTRGFIVLRRPIAAFKDCDPEHPSSILVGRETPLTVFANASDAFDLTWEVVVKYQPPSSYDQYQKSGRRFLSWERAFRPQGKHRDVMILASAPGTYSILQVKDAHCAGEVASPDSCEVVEQSMPKIQFEWKRFDDCYGEVGVAVSTITTGTPPFLLSYRLQREGGPPLDLQKSYSSAQTELIIQPPQSGRFVISFLTISDKHYTKVDARGPTIHLDIPQPASAKFLSGYSVADSSRKVLDSCESGFMTIPVEFEGKPSWEVEVKMAYQENSDLLRIGDLNRARDELVIPLPADMDSAGSVFDLDLVHIEDSRQCQRSLTVPGLRVNVRTNKPLAGFESDNRSVTILEQAQASLPVQFSGEGPWTLKYHRAEFPNLNFTAKFTTRNGILPVFEKGTYTLLEVSDSYCTGEIMDGLSQYIVNWIPRPTVRLAPHVVVSYDGFGRSRTIPSICQEIDDFVDIDLIGQPPFQILYDLSRRTAASSATKSLFQLSANSMEYRTRLQLYTSHPGRMVYDIQKVGDAKYPLSKLATNGDTQSERLIFEQQVFARPTARFRALTPLLYYLNDALTPSNLNKAEAVVVLQGIPPFRLQITIHHGASRQMNSFAVESSTSAWTLNIPEYNFQSLGQHIITIDSVFDSSDCGEANLDPAWNKLVVDVASTASLMPLDDRGFFCVGDTASFDLEGTPPWTIGYRINGKSQSKVMTVNRFSVRQDVVGQFAITSVTNNKIRKLINNMNYPVYGPPSAKVAQGRQISQEIWEGDRAEIQFTLIGEPPFTFTYQRSEPTRRFGGQSAVLETRMVENVPSNVYTITASSEGTWQVTFISDAHCRYPRAEPANEE